MDIYLLYNYRMTEVDVLYGLLRIVVNNMPKLVYIKFCGEGVMGTRRALFQGHSNEIRDKLMRIANCTIEANNEEDLEEAVVLEKVTKASGGSSQIQAAIPKQVPRDLSIFQVKDDDASSTPKKQEPVVKKVNYN